MANMQKDGTYSVVPRMPGGAAMSASPLSPASWLCSSAAVPAPSI
nr:hypothetical protein [Microbacterium barkeri]